MNRVHASRLARRSRHRNQRGSVLLTALIFAIIIGVSLVSYLQLSTNSLRQAHRTFFADAAGNLAETGLEEAVWSFNTMGNSSDPSVIAAAWSNWTLGGTVADVVMNSMGSGYTSAPTVSFSGGGGSGAAGTATIGTVYVVVGGVTQAITAVTGVTITNPGQNYTSAPTITLSGGGGSGAVAIARLSGTRTLTFPNLDQNATGTVKVWVAGYDGSTNVPIIVVKATVTPIDGPPIDKYVKVIVSKNGLLPKGVIAKYDINWNGHPFADSFISSPSPGVPPFTVYDPNTARSNTTVASLYGPDIDLAHGTVNGNVMTGPGVTVTGGTINGQQIGNFQANITLPPYPTNLGGQGYADLGTTASLPATLPRPADVAVGPATDGNYYYFVNGATIQNVNITAGKKVVIVGTNTDMEAGVNVLVSGASVGSLTVYMDGPIQLSGNDTVNTTSWAGALKIYTSTASDCSFSGNATFYGCLTAPNAALTGNGGGNNQEDLCGSFIARTITSNGHMNFHYDEGLNNLTTGKPWSLSLWRELQTASDRAQYSSKFDLF